jgi:hypothetical protein
MRAACLTSRSRQHANVAIAPTAEAAKRRVTRIFYATPCGGGRCLGEGGFMSTNPLSPWGPFYGNAPALQDAINHAERLAGILKLIRPRGGDDRGAVWLVGRIDEMEIFVELVIQRWRFEGLHEESAEAAITAYLDTLHHGLALHFGELSLRCCCNALFTTSVPETTYSEAETVEIPSFDSRRRSSEKEATVMDVDPSELLGGFPSAGPITPTPQV